MSLVAAREGAPLVADVHLQGWQNDCGTFDDLWLMVPEEG